MADVVKRAQNALDRRDPNEIESLRDVIRAEHIAALLADWRASLPWPVKDLYVALLMDQKDARLEALMADALDSPVVETRAYAISYLSSSYASFDQLLSAGGWVDPAKVDAAIVRYRAESGHISKQPPCPQCGAPVGPSDTHCKFCSLELRVTPGGDPSLHLAEGRHWQLQTGVPISKQDPELQQVATVIRMPQMAMKFKAMDGRFGDVRSLTVNLHRFEGHQRVLVTSSENPVKAESTTLYKGWTIGKRADYEVEVINAATSGVLARARFRIV